MGPVDDLGAERNRHKQTFGRNVLWNVTINKAVLYHVLYGDPQVTTPVTQEESRMGDSKHSERGIRFAIFGALSVGKIEVEAVKG